MKVDIHCHSIHSDGTWSVEKLLTKAEEKGIEVFCITDHDNFEGTIEAWKLNAMNEIYTKKLIAGIEVSTSLGTEKLHMLSLYDSVTQIQNSEIYDVTLEMIENRENRMEKIVEKANEIGLAISMEEIIGEAKKESTKKDLVLSRPHVGRLLVKKGYVKTLEEAFDKYLRDGKPLGIPKISKTLLEWISLTHKSGGIIVWAHPLAYRNNSIQRFQRLIESLKSFPLDGVELVYDYTQKYVLDPQYEKEGNEILKQYITQHNLLKTAGGDFHGDVGVIGELELDNVSSEALLRKLKVQKEQWYSNIENLNKKEL